MTIWFHEGLPRSGKSYEAMVKHALPAIQSGRHVVSNIKGINCEKIAEVSNMAVQDVEALVTVIPWDETLECWKYVKNDCLLLLDEVQDFWPATRDRLGKEVTELITQHGQRGLDIILMGQSQKDCHALWRRRIDKLIYFVQKDAVGKPSEYAWTLSKQTAPDKFAKINSGGGKYDSKFFGVYSSHVQGTNNKEAYADARANIWKTPAFRFGIPAAAVVGVFAVGYLIHFLSTPGAMVKTASAAALPVAAGEIKRPSVVPVPASAVAAVEFSGLPVGLEPYIPPPDFLELLIKDYRPRLSGYIQGKFNGQDKLVGKIEFYMADGQHRRDVLTFDAIRALGWTIEVMDFGVLLSKGQKAHPVTAWPFDLAGQVPQVVQHSGYITGQSEPYN